MTDIQERVEDDFETELSRLGSSKALYALTGGEMETEAVVAGLADRAATAAATFEAWSADDAFGGLFETAADTAGDLAERIAETADDHEPTDAPTAADEALRDLEDADARLGGLLAWTMVTDRTLSQAVGFFVGNADPGAADLFRDLRSGLDDLREVTIERAEDADRDATLAAASRVVEAAYDDYVGTLEGLGVKVKPVC